jgi:hypothetical protein
LGFAGVFPSEKIRRKQSKRNGKKQFNMEWLVVVDRDLSVFFFNCVVRYALGSISLTYSRARCSTLSTTKKLLEIKKNLFPKISNAFYRRYCQSYSLTKWYLWRRKIYYYLAKNNFGISSAKISSGPTTVVGLCSLSGRKYNIFVLTVSYLVYRTAKCRHNISTLAWVITTYFLRP